MPGHEYEGRQPVTVGDVAYDPDSAVAALVAEVERLRASESRLQRKLHEVAAVIGLDPGGGTGGYLLPAVERLVAERDRLRKIEQNRRVIGRRDGG